MEKLNKSMRVLLYFLKMFRRSYYRETTKLFKKENRSNEEERLIEEICHLTWEIEYRIEDLYGERYKKACFRKVHQLADERVYIGYH